MENIFALSLPIVLFIFWLIIGYATLSLFYSQRNILQNALMAPAVGLSVTIVLIFILFWQGYPVEKFGLSLFLVLILCAAIILWWNKPKFPNRKYIPFACIFLFALWFTGRPLLEFGFSWLSYTNDDMAHYCLGAIWCKKHGILTTPPVNQIINGSDYSLMSWFSYVSGMQRFGAELLLAWVSGLLKLMPDKIFMPIIICLHMVLISITGAVLLTLHSHKWRQAALVTCLLMSISALNSLGTFHQLIAQVGGLSILVLCILLLFKTEMNNYRLNYIRHGALVAFAVTAVSILYSELLPILGVSLMAYLLLILIQSKIIQKKYWIMLVIAAFATVIFINSYFINIFAQVYDQVARGFMSAKLEESLFPYFLQSSGLAYFWGILPIAKYLIEPFQSLSIIIGASLTCIMLVAAIWLSWRLYSIAILTFVMSILGVYMISNHNDFGIFKMAMYIQPFMLSTLVALIYTYIPNKFSLSNSLSLSKTSVSILFIFAILFFAELWTHYSYLERSRGKNFEDIRGASRSKINDEFKRLVSTFKKNQAVILDTNNAVLADLQSLYLRHHETYFLSKDLYLFAIAKEEKRGEDYLRKIFRPEIENTLQMLLTNYKNSFLDLSFSMLDGDKNKSNKFRIKKTTLDNNATFVSTTKNQTVFNKRYNSNYKSQGGNFISLPFGEITNHLIFINSNYGQHYYLPENSQVSLYPLENDPYYPNETMSAVGRYLLFELIHPSPNLRLVVDITTRFNQEKTDLLPEAMIIGSDKYKLAIIGRGSARVFSSLINPQYIQNLPFVTLDMGVANKHSNKDKSINADSRNYVVFIRDISLISNEDYLQLNAPSSIANFPMDLTNPNLEYSGIYEDGWIADRAYFNLAQRERVENFILKGMVPGFNSTFKPIVSVLIDGKLVAKKQLIAGNFSLTIPVESSPGRHKVDIHFSNTIQLPKGDNRPAAARIDFIGYDKQA